MLLGAMSSGQIRALRDKDATGSSIRHAPCFQRPAFSVDAGDHQERECADNEQYDDDGLEASPTWLEAAVSDANRGLAKAPAAENAEPYAKQHEQAGEELRERDPRKSMVVQKLCSCKSECDAREPCANPGQKGSFIGQMRTYAGVLNRVGRVVIHDPSVLLPQAINAVFATRDAPGIAWPHVMSQAADHERVDAAPR